nr:uncharacterized protein LOC106684017 [Halyomorpha halys]
MFIHLLIALLVELALDLLGEWQRRHQKTMRPARIRPKRKTELDRLTEGKGPTFPCTCLRCQRKRDVTSARGTVDAGCQRKAGRKKRSRTARNRDLNKGLEKLRKKNNPCIMCMTDATLAMEYYRLAC